MVTPRDRLVIASLVVLASLVAPRAAAASAPQSPTTSPTLLADLSEHPVPIHAEADGIWAAGRDYKASFREGFVFHPYLTLEFDRQMPWRWRTIGLSRDRGTRITGAHVPRHVRTDLRYEYHHSDSLCEAYAVLPGGVEQTFRIGAPLPGSGDLVLRGVVETPLHCDAVRRVHRDLVFRDDQGREVVRYSQAWAYDAAGRRTKVTTTFDSGHVELRVPEPWLERAAYPIVIDPLTSSLVMASVPGQISYLDIARDSVSSSHALMVVCGYRVSSTDYDVRAWLVNDDFTDPRLVFSDVSANLSSAAHVAFAGGASRWVVAVEGMPNSAYFHDAGNLVLNSGTSVPFNVPLIARIEIGGSRTGNGAMIVLEEALTRRLYSIAANAENRTVGLLSVLTIGGTGTGSYLTISPVADDDTWLVAWLDGSNIESRQIGGTPSGQSVIAFGLPPLSVGALRVAGAGGKYMAVAKGVLSGLTIWPIDWPQGTLLPSVGAPRTAAARGVLEDLEFDSVTRSHWLVLNRTSQDFTVQRLGPSGVVQESTLFTAGMGDATITFDATQQRFPVIFSDPSAPSSVHGLHYVYPQAAGHGTYGIGCGGTIGSRQMPLLGNRSYAVDLTGAPPQTGAGLLISLGRANVELSGIGAPGCYQNVDFGALFVGAYTTVSDAAGAATIALPLPEDPTLAGNLDLQWVYGDPLRNAAGIATTSGLEARVR